MKSFLRPVSSILPRLAPALALAPLLLTFACAPSGQGGDPPPGTKPVVVRFWNGFSGPDGDMMKTIVDEFNAGQNDVQVKMEIIPWGTYYDKVTLGLAFGGAPDLFVLHAARLPEYASHDVLSPLNADLKAAGLGAEKYFPATWQAASWDGVQYALPLDIHPVGLYYNLDLFRAAGITEPPRTYDEFVADAKRLTVMKGSGRSAYQQWGFAFTNLQSNSTLFLNQYGTAMLTPDLQRSALETPAARAAFGRMTDLIYKEKVAPKPEGQDAWLGFQTGKVAMAIEGVYMKAGLDAQKTLHYAAAPVPRFGTQDAAMAGSHLLVMPKDEPPRRRAAAWRFATYLSAHSVEWAAGGQIPARKDLQNTPAFQALTVQAQFARQLPYIVYEPRSTSINLVNTFKDSAVEKILNRIVPEDEALSDANRRIDNVLARQADIRSAGATTP